MRFIVAYDEDTSQPLNSWPYDWVKANDEEWRAEIDEAYADAVFIEQSFPANMAPVEIADKEYACLGLKFRKGIPVMAIYGNHLLEHYFVCDADVQVLAKHTDWQKAVLATKE